MLEERSALARQVLPIIDMAAARGNDAAAKQALARQIDHAFSTSGFCYVVNHGGDARIIDEAFKASGSFFHAPLDAKMKVAPSPDTLFRGYLADTRKYRTYADFNREGAVAETEGQSVGGKENFIFSADGQQRRSDVAVGNWVSGPNPWPQGMPEFRAKSYALFQDMHKVGADILRMIALALGIDENFFRGKYGDEGDTSLGTLCFYNSLTPAEFATGKQNLREHVDFSCITLLLQDQTGGLQVQERSSKDWVNATPIPGAIVVNVGDLLARWSNNRYVSTPHRVRNVSGAERLSIAITYNPRADAAVDPRELGVSEKDAKYPTIQAGRYAWDRMMETGGSDEDIAAAAKRPAAE